MPSSWSRTPATWAARYVTDENGLLAARGLVGLERALDALGQRFDRLFAGLDDADAGGDRAVAQLRLRDVRAAALGEDARAVERGAGHHDRELVAAEAEARVHHARVRVQDRRDAAQQLVAGCLAEAIACSIEPIEIEHRDRERLAVAAAARELDRDALLERAAVEQAREGVVQVVGASARKRARAVKRDRDDLREDLERLDVLVAERVARGRRGAEHPDRVLAVEHRDVDRAA